MKTKGLRFCVIGKGGLAVECLQMLADRGHEVVYVISTDDKLIRWAQANHARLTDTSRALPEGFDLSQVDYLFSIANGEILPESLLKLPRRLAINYHNGPLPKYAGVHATAWAILNGERSHGVTWHVMEPAIDAGDVLKQALFPIDEDESTLTLNLKCYEHALEAFRQLLPELENDSYQRRPQDLKERSYFSLKKKPFGVGLISWASEASQINRLCRALNFGSYPNELGIAKFLLGDEIFVPLDLTVTTHKSGEEPGMLVGLMETEIRVATATEDVAFSEVAKLSGERLKARDLITQFLLGPGQKLFVPDYACLQEFSERVDANFVHENFWREQLRTTAPVPATAFLGAGAPSTSGPQSYSTTLSSDLLEKFGASFAEHGGVPNALLTAVLIYIYRIYRKSWFTVLFSKQSKSEACTSIDRLFERVVPFNITLKDTMTAAEALTAVGHQAELIDRHDSYLKDVPYRDPYLPRGLAIPGISIVVGEQFSNESPLTIGIDAGNGKLALLTNSSTVDLPPLSNALDHITTLLQAIAEDPKQSIAKLALLPSHERNQVVYEWNETTVNYDPVTGGAYELFERQAKRRPSAVAVSSESGSLTYGELRERAERLAGYLRQLGVGPDTAVCVQMERSPELVVALLGILRAGGVYVPLDMGQPARRREFILRDTQPPVLLVSGTDEVPEYEGTVVRLEGDWWNALESAELSETDVSEEQLAYIMYTSGTTGEPKGVLCPHGGLVNRLQWSLATYGMEESDVLLQNAAVGFDISVWEMLFPLMGGARLVTAAAAQQKDAAALLDQVEREGVTVIHLVPSLLGVLLEQAAISGGGRRLRWVVSGGEALRPELRRRFEAQLEARLFHAYGPTEASISVAHWECKRGEELWHVPIGKPIANTQLYVLDEAQEPVGIGVVGEIYIGGVGVGRGYLGRATLTAERFVCDRFRSGGGVLYRTGDRGRFLSDGNIEYVGRGDRQVKVRGQRVELGEVETVLAEQTGVGQAVVVSHAEAGSVELVGYVTLSGNGYGTDAAALVNRLKAGLRERLPEYMVPGRIMVLDDFPLTPNGKLDLAALPRNTSARSALQNEYVCPETALERRLSMLWSKLLGEPRVGVHDNFFALGGHSLLASQVILFIRQKYEVNLPLRSVFESPTIAGLARLIKAKREDADSDDKSIIPSAAETGDYPLTFSQERLWVLDQLLPGGIYNISFGWNLKGRVDCSRLQNAFEELIARHEVLRSSVRVHDGEARLAIANSLTFTLDQLDLTDDPITEDGLHEILRQKATKPFDLEKGPLFRVCLIRRREQESVLLMVFHHFILDGWSAEILSRELSLLYGADLTEHPLLAPLPIRYRDYAVWQRQRLKNGVLSRQLSYWTRQLQDLPEPLNLSPFEQRPQELGYRGALYRQEVDKEVVDRLKTLSESHGATLFMALLGTFKVLLHRYSGSNDIIVGSPFANRNGSQIQDTVGLFVNTVALRTNCGGNPTFLELLSQVTETTLDALEHQECPFQLVTEALGLSSRLNANPIFQVMFVLNKSWQQDIHFQNLEASRLHIDPGTSMLDLTLMVEETATGVLLEWEYAGELFERDFIVQLASHYTMLLERISIDPELKIDSISLLSQEESQRCLIEWNETRKAYPPVTTINRLFEEQVARAPARIAIVSGNEQITYDELNAKSNQLGRYLRGLGAQGSVAICHERSLSSFIAILAILKCGASYLPLDPLLPDERLRFMLEDGAVGVALTQSSLLSRFTAYDGRVVELDHDWSFISQELVSDLEDSASPSDLVYTIYTSGSTGTPKGVMVQHKSLLNYVRWATEYFELRECDRVLQFASLSFDTSAEEIYPILTVGGTLVLPEPGMLDSAAAFLDFCARYSISVIDLPTAYWHQLVGLIVEENLVVPECIRLVIIGGDRAHKDRVAAWHRHLAKTNRKVRLVNTYGPTESTIAATACELHPGNGESVPIGRPIANTQVYLLDNNFLPVPVGVTGELFVAGAGVAKGYLNRPELTVDKFIPARRISALALQTNGNMVFRTGDFARWRIDGQLEYIGRSDNQVKVRGYRVELGEIEAVLARHRAIKSVAVVARKDETGEHDLVAFIVGHAQQKLSPVELRQFLAQTLPGYSIPGMFVALEKMPLLINGKVDRQKLATIPFTPLTEVGYEGQRTELESLMSEIWSEVLGISPISIHENFFLLGGQSLSGVRLIAKLRARSIEVSLHTLFQYPTIAELAAHIEQNGKGSAPPVLEPRHNKTEAPLSFSQQRLWFIEQLFPDTALYSMPMAFSLKGALDVTALKKSFAAVSERHAALRTRLEVDGEYVSQTFDSRVELTVSEVDPTVLDERLKAEALRPFNLFEEPLFRARLFKTGPEQHVLLLNFHHLIADDWSVRVFMRELEVLYAASRGTNGRTLPRVGAQYPDFIDWQSSAAMQQEFDRQLEYWKQHLDDAPLLLELPLDRERPKERSYSGDHYTLYLPQTTTSELASLGESLQATSYMCLLASFFVLLQRYSGQSNITIGSLIANRRAPELEHTIGLLVNTVALRVECRPDLTFAELLAIVRDVTLNAFENQDVPFDEVVEALDVPRAANLHPLFQSMFTFEEQSAQQYRFGAIDLSELNIETGLVKFDLSLTARETQSGLALRFDFADDIFDRTTIERWARNLNVLLNSIVANPNQQIGELALLTEEEVDRQVVDWNQTARVYDSNLTVHELFELQVEKTPSAVAAVFENSALTFLELDRRANRLAHYLAGKGVSAEDMVCVAVDRSLDHLVVLLAILKAGGVYVPLNFAHPSERLQLILEDVCPRVVIATSAAETLLQGYKGNVVYVDREAELIAQMSNSRPEQSIRPDNLAYAMYTSGSAGRPKGVLCTHGGLVNRLQWCSEAYPIDERDRLLQIAALGFDISLWEMLFPLVRGARLIIAPPSVPQDIERCAELISEHEVTIIHFIPTLLKIFLRQTRPEQCASIKQVVCGGELVSKELYSDFLEHFDAAFHHAYGPTEASISITHWQGTKSNLPRRIPLGRPIANTKLYVLDSYLKPAPIGAPGELCIGGRALARGYLNQPDLTAEKFVPDAFSLDAGARLYRTGDLARYLATGEIEFLGRADQQVKLHGYRIELAEIEMALATYPAVRECVVTVVDDNVRGRYLAAYIVSDASVDTPSAKELRRHLKKKLPDYMVPTTFTPIPKIPLTASGKVNYRALPAPELKDIDEAEEYVPASSEIERTLAKIWAEVLGVARVGVNHNFFQLGGDSILSIKITARARNAGLYFEIKDLFEASSIAELAQRVRLLERSDRAPATAPVLTGPIPLTPIQRQFLMQDWKAPRHYNQAILLRCVRRLEWEHFAASVAELVNHHHALRLRFRQGEDGEWVQEYGEPVDELCELIDLSTIHDEDLESAIEENATRVQKSLDLTHGPLFRAAFLECGPTREQRLLLVGHHLVVDDVSWGILIEDLTAGFAQKVDRGVATEGHPYKNATGVIVGAALRGRPSVAHFLGQLQFPVQTDSYRTWSLALEKYGQQESVRAEADYWLHETSGGRVLRPKVSTPPPEGTTLTLLQTLNQEATKSLTGPVNDAYRTKPLEILLTALALAAAEETRGEAVGVMMERHGRVRAIGSVDTTRTCGWFTSVHPLTLQLSKPGDLGQSVKEVKEKFRGVPREGIGYGILRYLTKDQALRDAAAPQLSFNYLGERRRMETEGALWSIEDQGYGPSIAEENARQYELEISSEIVNGQLETRWSYSHQQFDEAQVRQFAERYQSSLKALIKHCSGGIEYGYTPSDFPLAKLDQGQIDDLLSGRKDVEDVYPLAPMQLGFLFHSLYKPESQAYFVQMTFELEGPVDEEELRKAWQFVARRHAALRTAFLWQGQKPLQYVQRNITVPWESLNWTTTHEGQIESILAADRNRPFTLSEAPLFHLTFIRLSESRSVLIWTHHHILLDGWSLPLVLSDVETAYEQRLKGVSVQLPPRNQFREFIQSLETRDADQAEKFWRDYLSGLTGPTRLARKDEFTTKNDGYGAVSFSLSLETLQRVQREFELTMSAVLEGAWALLLSQYTQQDDVVFGITLSGRSSDVSTAENIVGLLINTVPLRVRLSPDDDVLEFLQRLREQTFTLQEHAYVSLAKIQSWSGLSRGKDLFDTLFVFENYPREETEDVGGLSIRSIQMFERTEYPLTINIMPGKDVLVEMTYQKQSFDDAQIQTIARQFQHFIITLINNLVETNE